MRFHATDQQSGQSIIEAVIVLSVCIPFILLAMHVFYWLTAKHIVIHAAREAVKTVSITGNPKTMDSVLRYNMRYLNPNFDPHGLTLNGTSKNVEVYVTDNLATPNPGSGPNYSTDARLANWYIDLANPARFGIVLTIHYELPNKIRAPFLGQTLSSVHATSWAPFSCTLSSNYATCDAK